MTQLEAARIVLGLMRTGHSDTDIKIGYEVMQALDCSEVWDVLREALNIASSMLRHISEADDVVAVWHLDDMLESLEEDYA